MIGDKRRSLPSPRQRQSEIKKRKIVDVKILGKRLLRDDIV